MPDRLARRRRHFGPYGGRFVPEALVAALDELDRGVPQARRPIPAFPAELDGLLRDYTGRPVACSPRRSGSARSAGGARILLKREDLNHTGSHKINNVLGQALLTKRMGKTRVIAETGAGQHGVATATAAALLGLECAVYMGEEDTAAPGAQRGPDAPARRRGRAGHHRLAHPQGRDQRGDARLGHQRRAHPLPASAPSPARTRSRSMVRDFQRIIGDEARAQVLELIGRLPDAVAACVGGGSNAIGIFPAFVPDDGGARWSASRPAATASRPAGTPPSITGGAPGVLHGARTYLLQDDERPDRRAHSISAGLDYPGVGPEHAWLHDTGRADYRADHRRPGDGGLRAAVPHRGHHPGDRVGARRWPARCSSAASCARLGREAVILVNLSGRGDKDVRDRRRRTSAWRPEP